MLFRQSLKVMMMSAKVPFYTSIDLPQVDLTIIPGENVLASESSFFLREVNERATKSREVDLSRLQGFHLRLAPKRG